MYSWSLTNINNKIMCKTLQSKTISKLNNLLNLSFLTILKLLMTETSSYMFIVIF